MPNDGGGARALRLRSGRASGRPLAGRDQIPQDCARALCGKGCACRPDQALRFHGTRASGRTCGCHRRPGFKREYTACKPTQGSRGDHADQCAVDRQPSRPEAQTPADSADDRRISGSGAQGTGMTGIARMSTGEAGFEAKLAKLLAFESNQDEHIESTVEEILRNVRSRGDAAVLEYTKRFDKLEAASLAALEIPRQELDLVLAGLPAMRRSALEQAAMRIRSYHERQPLVSWQYAESDGTTLGQKVTPLDRVGVYVPGGKAAYPSTVLMNALPAKVAGVSEVIMVVPTPRGERNDLVLAAASIAGVDRVFTIGGAQAVAALAYGTQTIAQVDKIVGPGNVYVAAAKRRVFGVVGIDMIAGPSEILIIADASANADWIAMDLFSQAEHDEMAQAILLCPDAGFIDKVAASIDRQIKEMPRASVITASLDGRGALIETRDLDEACGIANRIAPEHLELSVEEPQLWAEKIRHAGAVFLGRYTSEALGDYCAGPNHVLPTSRTARFSSPLGVYDFQKRTSIIAVSRKGARKLGKLAMALANGEGFQAHARSAELRIRKTLKGKA